MSRLRKRYLVAAAVTLAACDKPAEPTTTPEPAAAIPAEPTAEESAEPSADEKAPAKEKKKEGTITVATFNLAWAHDHIGDAPKRAEKQRAKTKADWDWKVKAIAEIIAEAKPDLVALHELGGDEEISDIVAAIKDAKGPGYEWAHQNSEDVLSGHHTAILSRMSMSDERRLKLHMRRHLAVDVTLPGGDTVTVIAIHAPEGSRERPTTARRKQVEALVRVVNKIRANRPVIVLGTLGSNIEPGDDGYNESAPGMLAGADTASDKDDCFDSSAVGAVGETTPNEVVADRIFACGITMTDAKKAGVDKIVRQEVDAWDKPWPEVPVDKPPHRDVSDHYMVVGEIEQPKPPDEAKKDADKND
jgi:endonuclease/exonuclease/phosphatase family metal-dependent hydrolase